MTDEMPADWFFTFGPDHKHPVTGESLGGKYVRVHGTCDGTREAMFAVFGNRWASQYTPATDFAYLVKRFGWTEITMPEVTP